MTVSISVQNLEITKSFSDYDYLAAPVHQGKSTIYFAGEHTNRHYPSSVHGAYLSGLREAGRIADNYLDTPYNINKVGFFLSDQFLPKVSQDWEQVSTNGFLHRVSDGL